MDSAPHKQHAVTVLPPAAFAAGVTNLWSNRLRYVAHSHICKLYIYCEKLHTHLEGWVYSVLWFLHVHPMNQPTITVLAHKQK